MISLFLFVLLVRKNPSSCDCTEIRTHVLMSEGFEVTNWSTGAIGYAARVHDVMSSTEAPANVNWNWNPLGGVQISCWQYPFEWKRKTYVVQCGSHSWLYPFERKRKCKWCSVGHIHDHRYPVELDVNRKIKSKYQVNSSSCCYLLCNLFNNCLRKKRVLCCCVHI